jgi:NAD+ synthase
MKTSALSADILKINPEQEAARIENAIRETVFQRLRRKGAVLGLSGGIDSSVTVALCTRALGRERVAGLLMPESDSSPESLELGKLCADSLGIRTFLENITEILKGSGCYRRRDDTIRMVVPEYSDKYRCKIVMPNVVHNSGYSLSFLVVRSPSGEERRVRLTAEAYRGIVAATNFKQRVRKMMEYYYADRFNYAVVGTPNLLEYDQGFFVKNGDGAADLKPIAHLYKSQVYQLAEHLGIPEEIRSRPSTTDTFSLQQSQEEFFFALPLQQMDLCLYAKNRGIAAADIADAVGLTSEQVENVYATIDSKRVATRYQHMAPIMLEPIVE